MPAIALKAHYDGEHIVLDEPCNLPLDGKLMVVWYPDRSAKDSEAEWLRAVASSGSFDFLADPAEDVYTLEDGEPLTNAV